MADSGRPPTATTADVDENLEHVQNIANTSPQKGMQVTSLLNKALFKEQRNQLTEPYKICFVYVLQEDICEKRFA